MSTNNPNPSGADRPLPVLLVPVGDMIAKLHDDAAWEAYMRAYRAITALIARNAELEKINYSWRIEAEGATAERDALAADNLALRETLAIVKANAIKTAPLLGYPATGAQWLIGFATDNGALSFDKVFDNAIAVARTSAAENGND
jgi:hypothetical protein